MLRNGRPQQRAAKLLEAPVVLPTPGHAIGMGMPWPAGYGRGPKRKVDP